MPPKGKTTSSKSTQEKGEGSKRPNDPKGKGKEPAKRVRLVEEEEEPEAPPSQVFKLDKFFYFITKPALQNYVINFKQRLIATPRWITRQYLTGMSYNALAITLSDGKWNKFLMTPIKSINEDLVRIFYANLTKTTPDEHCKVYTTTINNTTFEITDATIHQMTGLCMTEAPFPDFNEVNYLVDLGVTMPKGKGRPTITGMNPEARCLHYLLTHIIVPRSGSLSYISQLDATYMYMIMYRSTYNWCRLIRETMYDAKESDAALPYAHLVMALIYGAGIDTSVGQNILKSTGTWEIKPTTFKRTGVHITSSPPRQSAPASSNPDLIDLDDKVTMAMIAKSLNSLHLKSDAMKYSVDAMSSFLQTQFGFDPDPLNLQGGGPRGDQGQGSGQGGDQGTGQEEEEFDPNQDVGS